MTALGLQPFLAYPAVIKLWHRGEQRSFDSLRKAEDFISSLSQKAAFFLSSLLLGYCSYLFDTIVSLLVRLTPPPLFFFWRGLMESRFNYNNFLVMWAFWEADKRTCVLEHLHRKSISGALICSTASSGAFLHVFWECPVVIDLRTRVDLVLEFRIRFFFYLSHTRLYREYITSSEMYSMHLTHPKWTHTRKQWAAMFQRPGSSWVSGALLKDTSVVVLMEERSLVIHSPTNNPCRTRDSNPQPLDYKSNSLTIRPRLLLLSSSLQNDCFADTGLCLLDRDGGLESHDLTRVANLRTCDLLD